MGSNVYITNNKAVQLPRPEPKIEYEGGGYTNASGFFVPKENVKKAHENEVQWVLGMDSELQICIDKREKNQEDRLYVL